MSELSRGLYEILVTEALDAQLGHLEDHLAVVRGSLRAAETADRIALHIARVVERAIGVVDERERPRVGVDLARRLVDLVTRHLPAADSLRGERPAELAEVLRSIVGHLPDGRAESISEPLIPLLDTTLLTNAPGEPRVGHQVLAELHSADRIDVVMAFIRRSGIAPLIGALRDHCAAGRRLRVLTTTYTGTTGSRDLHKLLDLGYITVTPDLKLLV